ncbi:MAG: HAMP domain-containing protein, partial [Planctomycetota bacterium]|nr:HAMP domain-containing protein [Planctomycetota bacterium]
MRASSIRWTLIGWYGLLLAAVLGAFGTTLYLQAVDATLGAVDVTLDDRARVLAAALELDPEDGWEIDLSEDYLRGLAADAYFGVWAADGTPVLSGGDGGPDGPPDGPAATMGLHTRGDLREVSLAGPAGSRILVGRSIRPEHERLADLLAVVVGAGLGVLVFGLCGGWWLARRTLAPVGALTEAAAAVGPDDLATRLDEQGAPSELRGLARAFNATLDRLEAAFLRQARFVADASHELRTPIAIVRAQAEVALKEQRSAGDYRATLETCLRAAERMTNLVEGLLALARADAGEGRPVREDVAFDTLVR